MAGSALDRLRVGDRRESERFLRKPFTPDELIAEVVASLA